MAISRKRSGITGVVLLAVVLALFGAAGYYVWRSGGFALPPARTTTGASASATPTGSTSSAATASAETTGPQPTIALTTSNARDVVDTLLLARQAGDPTTMRLVTTARFQVAHSAWYDGRDNSALLTDWSIERAVQSGQKVTVTVSETWSGKASTRTYTVVREGGDILVSATGSK